MENRDPETIAGSTGARRWPLFLLGVMLVLLGPALYIVQFNLHQLTTPWYVPILASAGVLLMLVSVWQHGGVVRGVVLLLFVVVCGFEWFMVTVGSRTPAYAGPALVGQQVPSFATTLADGKTFTDQDLAQGTPSVLLFFRGRW